MDLVYERERHDIEFGRRLSITEVPSKREDQLGEESTVDPTVHHPRLIKKKSLKYNQGPNRVEE